MSTCRDSHDRSIMLQRPIISATLCTTTMPFPRRHVLPIFLISSNAVLFYFWLALVSLQTPFLSCHFSAILVQFFHRSWMCSVILFFFVWYLYEFFKIFLFFSFFLPNSLRFLSILKYARAIVCLFFLDSVSLAFYNTTCKQLRRHVIS